MEEKISAIDVLYAEFKANADVNAKKGNKAAGIRARKAALGLMTLLKEYRKESIEHDK